MYMYMPYKEGNARLSCSLVKVKALVIKGVSLSEALLEELSEDRLASPVQQETQPPGRPLQHAAAAAQLPPGAELSPRWRSPRKG